MPRLFDNPNALPAPIAYSRLVSVDPAVSCSLFDFVPVSQINPTGTVAHYILVDSASMLDSDVVGQLASPATPAEIGNLSGTYAARANFLNLPSWATWTASDVDNNITNMILSGWNQTQVNSYIDTTATNLAGAITVMKQLASAILTIRGILVAMGKAIVFLRQLVVQFTK